MARIAGTWRTVFISFLAYFGVLVVLPSAALLAATSDTDFNAGIGMFLGFYIVIAATPLSGMHANPFMAIAVFYGAVSFVLAFLTALAGGQIRQWIPTQATPRRKE